MSINRRAFLSNSLAMTTGGLLATAAPASLGMNSTTKETDPLFNQPYVDVDEWRDSPSRHRYIHGGFRGTDTRFIIRMPPAEQYEGRFFQYLTPISISELQAGQIWNGTFPDFCFASGAMAVVSNQGGEESNTLYANTNPYSIGAYRASAATARYARVLANEMYGAHRCYGYAFGGSGGAFRTLSCAENTAAWDGVVPYIHGSAGSAPNNYALRLRGLRLLQSKFPQIADALEPGGGDVYAALDDEERAVLQEITQLGYPIRAWMFHQSMGIGAISILFPGIRQLDPTYFDDFWTQPGYLGADHPEAFQDVRIQHRTRVTRIIMSSEAVEMGLPLPGLNPSADPNEAWRSFEVEHGGPLPVALQLEMPPPQGYLALTAIDILSGAAEGKRLYLAGMAGNIAALQFTPSNSLRNITDHIRIGDEIQIDNSDSLAFETYYRHAVLPPEYPVYNALRDMSGKPFYPQRPRLINWDVMKSAVAHELKGVFSGKMIVVNCLLDWDAAPWHADWYRNLVRNNYGEDYSNRYRLWYIDHGTHGRIPDPTRTVTFQGVLQQALRDLAAWVERDIAPPEETRYQLQEGQILVPASAAERKGVQPVVSLLANGETGIVVNIGEPVAFTADIEVPQDAGLLIALEWDFSAGPEVVAGEQGRFDIVETVAPARQLTLNRSHVFSQPGIYFPALRVWSHREGDVATPYARIANLGRVRVVVT